MIDRILVFLSGLIVILASALLLSSGLAFVMDLGNLPLQMWQAYASGALLFLSFLLAAINLFFAGHPLYEYWMIIIVGSIIAVCYLPS